MCRTGKIEHNVDKYYSLPNSIHIRPLGRSITGRSIAKAEQAVMNDKAYGPESDLITRCFRRFPSNLDADIVAMKIGLIDVTNSTNISKYKSDISVAELADIISHIKDIDLRIKDGDPDVVNEIAQCNGKKDLFSFASKYCCYHKCNVYGKDDYSIYDTVLRDHLPDYFSDITSSQIKRWRTERNYAAYNGYITQKLNALEITSPHRKREFDHFVWFNNR